MSIFTRRNSKFKIYEIFTQDKKFKVFFLNLLKIFTENFVIFFQKWFCSVNGGAIVNRSKPLISSLGSLRKSGLGPESPIFSICWCCERTAKRFTCTGIGTTILFVPEFDDDRPRPCVVRPALTRFHFARLFWNHIFTWITIFRLSTPSLGKPNFLTCTSLSFRLVAIWLRSVRLRYFLAWNSRSNSKSCSDVKAVRRLRDLDDPFFELFFDSEGLFEPPVPSSEHSLSDWHKSENYKNYCS